MAIDFLFGLGFVAIATVVLFSFLRSFSNFFSGMKSFQAMGKLGEGEVEEILEGENREEKLERARKRAERNGNTEKVEALEQMEEMGPMMDAMSGNVGDAKGEEATKRTGEDATGVTEKEEPTPSETDGSLSDTERTGVPPEEIPAQCPQQYCEATWEESGVLDDGGKYEVLPNGQVRCTDCGMITDIE